VRRAMSCGVCPRTWTLSKGTSLETVAVGFSSAGRYEGPTPRAGDCTPFVRGAEAISCQQSKPELATRENSFDCSRDCAGRG
jgi:hypothetical protein